MKGSLSRRRWVGLLLLAFLMASGLQGRTGFSEQAPAVTSGPSTPTPVPWPTARNVDPVTGEVRYVDNALGRSGGPYIGREEAIRIATSGGGSR